MRKSQKKCPVCNENLYVSKLTKISIYSCISKCYITFTNSELNLLEQQNTEYNFRVANKIEI